MKMHEFFAFMLLVTGFVVPSIFANPPASKKKAKHYLPKILVEVEAKYKKAETLTADFVQEKSLVMTQTKKTSQGKIQIKKPDRIRWETATPDKSTLIGNGEKFWFYTPPFDENDPDDRGQLMVQKPSQVQTKLAHTLLAGSFSLAKDMKITPESGHWFTLIPNPKTAGQLKKARFHVQADSLVIDHVQLEHEGGNATDIRLSQIKLGEELKADLFVFEAPPRTDIINQ